MFIIKKKPLILFYRQKYLAEELEDLYRTRMDELGAVNLTDSGHQTETEPSGSGSDSRKSMLCISKLVNFGFRHAIIFDIINRKI